MLMGCIPIALFNVRQSERQRMVIQVAYPINLPVSSVLEPSCNLGLYLDS